MSSTTFHSLSLTGTEREGSLLARVAARMVEARTRQADRAVNTYLLSLDNETLQNLGYDRETLKARTPGGYLFL